MDEVFGKYANINILAKAPAEWEQGTAETIMQGWITAFPKIDGIWADGGPCAIGAASVLLKNNMKLVPIAAEGMHGYLKIWHKNISNGLSSIGPVCPPYIARIALNCALKALEGHKVPKDVKLPLPEVTDENLSKYYDPSAPDEWFAFDKISQADIDKLLVQE
jgi:ribose transport system substrate-binding protein